MKYIKLKHIFYWTIFSFFVDIYFMIQAGQVESVLVQSFMIIEIVTIWLAYKMTMGQRWALLTMTVYYGIRSFNLYLDTVSFNTTSGLNLQLQIINFVGINVPTIIFFFVLIRESRKKPEMPAANKMLLQ